MSINALLGFGQKAYKVGKAVLKAAPEMTFGTSSEKVGKVLRESITSGKSVEDTARSAYRAINKAGQKKFFTRAKNNLKNLIPDMVNYTKAGKRLAKKKGTNEFVGALKGFGKGFMKKLPFVLAAFIVVSEIPNILKATMEKGIFQGIKETIKPVLKLTGAGIGAAVGSAICPGFGSLIGWIAGEWLAGKIVGKSYSEEQEEKEKIIAEYMQKQIAYQQQLALAMQAQPNPFGAYASNPYTANF